MKRLLTCFVFVLFHAAVQAGTCGEGKVLAVAEGAWDTNDLFVHIDYSVSRGDHAGTEWDGRWIVFRKANLDIERFRGMKAVAVSAIVSGLRVWSYTHRSGRCDNATELQIVR